jgi:hypothetical protein
MVPPLEENVALVLHKIDDLRLEPVPINEPNDGGYLNIYKNIFIIEYLLI